MELLAHLPNVQQSDNPVTLGHVIHFKSDLNGPSHDGAARDKAVAILPRGLFGNDSVIQAV